MEDFDPDLEDLEVYLETISLPTQLSPPQYGIGVILADRDDVANQEGFGFALRPATATTQSVHAVGSNSVSGAAENMFSPRAGIRALFTFSEGASRNPVPFVVLKSDDGNTEAVGPTNLGGGTQMMAAIDDWRIQIAVLHTGTTSGTPTIRARVHVRRLLRDVKYPVPAAAAKPSSGEIVTVWLGDSIARGYGDDQTPPDGEAGETVDAAIDFFESGTGPAASWPSTLGNSPNPGYVEPFLAAALAGGFSSAVAYRWATNGRDLSGMMTTDLIALRRSLADALVDPGTVDAVCIAIGTNDADSPAESAAFAALLPEMIAGVERVFYNARIVLFEPPCTAVTKPDIVAVNAALASVVAASTRRALIPGNGDAVFDTLHPTAAVYASRGAAAFTAWQGTT
jgi:lysophospholipase L1-like esterase